MRARVAQCKCPNGHAIIGLVVDNDKLGTEEIQTMLKAAIHAALIGEGTRVGLPIPKINGWCAICRATSDQWVYEVAWTKEFDSWEDLRTEAKEVELANTTTRGIIEWMRLHARHNLN